MITKFEQASSW